MITQDHSVRETVVLLARPWIQRTTDFFAIYTTFYVVKKSQEAILLHSLSNLDPQTCTNLLQQCLDNESKHL